MHVALNPRISTIDTMTEQTQKRKIAITYSVPVSQLSFIVAAARLTFSSALDSDYGELKSFGLF